MNNRTFFTEYLFHCMDLSLHTVEHFSMPMRHWPCDSLMRHGPCGKKNSIKMCQTNCESSILTFKMFKNDLNKENVLCKHNIIFKTYISYMKQNGMQRNYFKIVKL